MKKKFSVIAYHPTSILCFGQCSMEHFKKALAVAGHKVIAKIGNRVAALPTVLDIPNHLIGRKLSKTLPYLHLLKSPKREAAGNPPKGWVPGCLCRL